MPLLSGVLGKLIPRSQYRLIPGKGLGSLMFEFRLNPHAFYLSNVRNAINTSPGLNIGLTTMTDEMMNSDIANLANIQQYDRAWKVSNIFLNFELWTFDQYVH